METIEPLKINEALMFVDELAILRFFPSQPSARATLANRLCEWCRGATVGARTYTPEQQAAWLAAEASELDEYPGPGALHRMLLDKFYPAGPLAELAPMRPITVRCTLCMDAGTVSINGMHCWCGCKQAQLMKAETPEWIDTLNSMPGKRASPVRPAASVSPRPFPPGAKQIDEADIARVMAGKARS